MSREATSGVSRRLELAIQLITGAAVLIGVVLVLIELQQTRALTYKQMVQDRLGAVIEHNSRVYGEDLATVLEKACLNPGGLSHSEAIILETYFHNQIQQVYRNRTLQEVGGIGIVEGGISWRIFSREFVSFIAAYPGGREWLTSHPIYSNPKEAETDEVVAYVQSMDVDKLASTRTCKSQSTWVIPTI